MDLSPRVDGAVTSGSRVVDGLLDGGHDVVVFPIEGDDLHEGVELVPHLGGGEVVDGGLGVLAGGPLDARHLLNLSGGELHEAHSSGEVRLLDGSVLGGAAVAAVSGAISANGEETKAKDEGLEDEQDQQIRQVEGKHFRGGGGTGEHAQTLFQDARLVFGVGTGQTGCHDGCSVQVLHRV